MVRIDDGENFQSWIILHDDAGATCERTMDYKNSNIESKLVVVYTLYIHSYRDMYTIHTPIQRHVEYTYTHTDTCTHIHTFMHTDTQTYIHYTYMLFASSHKDPIL